MSKIPMQSLAYLGQYGFVPNDLYSDGTIDSYTSKTIQPNFDVYEDTICDLDRDGYVDYRQISLTDKYGRTKTLEIDHGGNNIFDEFNEYTYDSSGKISKITIKKDLDENGEYDYEEIRANNEGYPSRHTIDLNNDGILDYDKAVMYKFGHPGLKQMSTVTYNSSYYNFVKETGGDWESLNPDGGTFDHQYIFDMNFNIITDKYFENRILKSETSFNEFEKITQYTEFDDIGNATLIATPNVNMYGNIEGYFCDNETKTILGTLLNTNMPVPDGKTDFEVKNLEDFPYFQKHQ